MEVTRKFINEHFKNVINVPYCSLSNVFANKTPNYYNVGVYGWNWYAYIVNHDTAIITGYRNFPHGIDGTKNVKTADEKANIILKNSNYNYTAETFERLYNVLCDFVSECI